MYQQTLGSNRQTALVGYGLLRDDGRQPTMPAIASGEEVRRLKGHYSDDRNFARLEQWQSLA